MSRQICGLCPHHCRLEEGQIGLCRARGNVDGTILPLNYGKITSIALDPIEKKPLMRFYPGRFILSVGSFGCNLRCPFCQNHEISQAGQEFRHQTVMPEQLVQIAETLAAEPKGNLGVAFTYNEPLIGVEFLRDTAFLLKKRGMKVVLVTNGMMEEAPFRELLPLVDAMNIDLKAFHGEFYHWIGGDLETVKRNIRLAAGRKLLSQNGKLAFESGASATITGNMLTTSGSTIQGDIKMLSEMGRSVKAKKGTTCDSCCCDSLNCA